VIIGHRHHRNDQAHGQIASGRVHPVNRLIEEMQDKYKLIGLELGCNQ
jgi:hypothetical protein